MATVQTCQTPKEAWALVSHYLGNLLTSIGSSSVSRSVENEGERNRREDKILRMRSQLIGCLYELACRMNLAGCRQEEADISELLRMVMTQDLNNKDIRWAIIVRHHEMDPTQREFDEMVQAFNQGLRSGCGNDTA